MRRPPRPAAAAASPAPRVAGARRVAAAEAPIGVVQPAYSAPVGYGTSAPSTFWAAAVSEQVPELRWPARTAVYERMQTHSAVSSTLRAVRTPIEATRWYLDRNGARDEVVAHVAADLGLPVGRDVRDEDAVPRRRGRFSWSQHVREALTFLPHGHSYFEQLYRLDELAGLYHLHKLAFRRQETIRAVNVAADGGLESIEQHRLPGSKDPTERVVIEVDRLVAYTLDREGGNWLGRSILRPAYGHWLLANRLMPVQAETIERNGMGVPVYTDQENGTAATLAAGLAQATAARSGATSGAAVPNTASLDFKGVAGQLPNAERAIRYHDERIAATVLAHVLNLGQQTGTGSYALGETFADLFTLSLQGLAQLIADTANAHVVEDLVDVNYGPDEAAPLIRFDDVGSRPQATAASLKLLVDAGIFQPDRETEEFIRQRYGIPPKQAPGTPGSAIPTTPDAVPAPAPGDEVDV